MNINRQKFIKWGCYSLLIVFISGIQDNFFNSIRIFGVAPLVGGVLTACVAIEEGGLGGAVCGLICGIVSYLSPGNSEMTYTICYTVGGCVTGLVCDYMFRKKLTTALFWSAVLNFTVTTVYFIFFVAIPKYAGLEAYLTVGLGEAAYSTIIAPLIYFPVKAIHRIAD